jgi:hypothetical protein
MKRYVAALLVLISSVNYGKASDIHYPASAIPAALLKDADVVKRAEEIRFTIINTGQTVYYHKYALTILNEKGDDAAAFEEYYDQLQKITSIEGVLYDAAGNAVKKVKNKDIQDVSAVSDNNLMDDHRKKTHQFYYKAYPYTVEYEVEIKYNNTLFFPLWDPQEGEHCAVEQSSYTVVAPQNYVVRYQAFNYKGQPAAAVQKDMKILKWEVSNLAAIKRPFAAPAWRELTTVVYLAPSDFEVQGYKGSMNTWKDLGKFQTALNKDRDVLPDKVVQKVKSLTAGLTDDKDKISVLYNYLQKNTRYISVQLGIGGWQPMEASMVAEKGYGDCKALANYMHSLLKAAGIKANYTLVYAGDDHKEMLINDDFPLRNFNHAILCVPLAKDSVWLECTDQTLPAGYMSSFTANRKALMITDDGGVVVATPRYGLKENTQLRTIKGTIAADGTLNMKVATRYEAMQGDNLHSMINALAKDKVQKILQQELELPTYNINTFDYKEKAAGLPQVEENLDITVDHYATVSGKRLFITLDILNRSGTRLEDEEERKCDFVFNLAWRDEDNAEIDIPEGYELEAAPQDMAIKTRFGSYSVTAKLSGNKIIYRRVREQFGGRYPAKDKEELAKFYNDIYKSDRSRMVLVKKG